MVQIIDTTDNKEDITEEAINNIVDILDKTGGYKSEMKKAPVWLFRKDHITDAWQKS